MVRSAGFLRQASENFAFLTEEGFVGPERDEERLLYVSAHAAVEIHLDARDGADRDDHRGVVGDRTPRAGLSCLYVEAA